MTVGLDDIRELTLQASPSTRQIPSILWKGYRVFCYIHYLWRLYGTQRITLDPRNIFANLTLQIAHSISLRSSKLRTIIKCILIIIRFKETVDKYIDLCDSYTKLMEAIRGEFPIKPVWEPKTLPGNRWISPSTLDSIRSIGFMVDSYILRICTCALAVLKNGFELSMHMTDLVQAFSIDKNDYEATRDSAYGIGRQINYYMEHRGELAKQLADTYGIFLWLFSRGTTDQEAKANEIATKDLYYRLVDLFGTAANVGNAVIDTLEDLSKQTLFAFASLAGASRLLAECAPSLVPSLDPPWEKYLPPSPARRFYDSERVYSLVKVSDYRPKHYRRELQNSSQGVVEDFMNWCTFLHKKYLPLD